MSTTRTVSPYDFAAVVKDVKDRAIALADGTTGDWTDPRTGEVTSREKWFWLPKSQLRLAEPGPRGRPIPLDAVSKGLAVTATIPQWLAKEKGLL